MSVKPNEFLSDIRDKTRWEKPDRDYPAHPSGYFASKKAAAKNGTTLFPYNFVRIRQASRAGGNVEFKTLSKKGRWEKYGSLAGSVPEAWVRDCIYSQDLYPYAPQTGTKCIIPMRGGKWDPTRDSHPDWRKVSHAYKAHRGKGRDTPPTLEKRLDHYGSLTNQLETKKWLAVYNAGGENLYAMKAPPGEYIIEHGCFYVPCGSEAESDCAACSIPRPCCRHSTAQKRAACISGWPSGSACPYPDSTRRTNSMQGLRGCPAKPGSPLQRHTSPNAPAGTSGPTGAPPERYKRRSPKAAFPGRSTICAEP